MKRLLIIALLTLLPLGVYAQTSQEIAADQYCPKNIISQCSTYAKTNVIKFEYTSTTATASTITVATNVLTITIGGVESAYDTASTSLDTYAELAAAIEAAHSGMAVTLGAQTYGNETCDLSDKTATTCLNVSLGLTADLKLTLAVRLYMASKRPCIFRIVANTTFTGNSNIYIYKGSDPDSISGDTLIWSQTHAATTVDKDIDLHPYMIAGDNGGYLKVVVSQGTTLTAGTLTILGAYR